MIIIVGKINAVMQYRQVETDIKLFIPFPGKVGITQATDGLPGSQSPVQNIIGLCQNSQGRIIADIVITCYTITGAYLQQVDAFKPLHKRLIAYNPSCRYRGKITVLGVNAKPRRTVSA